jgi:hypothetical protein
LLIKEAACPLSSSKCDEILPFREERGSFEFIELWDYNVKQMWSSLDLIWFCCISWTNFLYLRNKKPAVYQKANVSDIDYYFRIIFRLRSFLPHKKVNRMFIYLRYFLLKQLHILLNEYIKFNVIRRSYWWEFLLFLLKSIWNNTLSRCIPVLIKSCTLRFF